VAKDRIGIHETFLNDAIVQIQQHLAYTLNIKGSGSFVSTHELLGVITEEYYELIEAAHRGNVTNVHGELLDIAAACIFGVACIERGEVT